MNVTDGLSHGISIETGSEAPYHAIETCTSSQGAKPTGEVSEGKLCQRNSRSRRKARVPRHEMQLVVQHALDTIVTHQRLNVGNIGKG
jgi:hypothetical protein